MTRPCFLVFITDQQRADWLGCMGHPVLRTPNIDSIANRGTLFTEFHVASPVCMPNRASLMTGRYPSQHGLRYNGCALPLRANTFVDVLRTGGYDTAAIGKSHLQPFSAKPPQPSGGNFSGEAWKTDNGDYSQEQGLHYEADGRYILNTPYYGYDHVDMVTGHGDQCGGHYRQWFRSEAPDWKALTARSAELPHNYSCPQAFRTPVPEELYPTAFIRDRAAEWLRGRTGEGAPFFLFVSFPDPHHPFNPPGRYWDLYSPDQFDVPLPYDRHENPPPPLKWLHERWMNGVGAESRNEAQMIDAGLIREAMALTAGMTAMVDDAVGDIMQALEESGHADRTVVCFTSDHGDYMGDFNMILKGALPFRSITRVPFIWSDPDSRQPVTSNVLGSTLDISATILERAGLQAYNGMMGRSLLGSLDGSDGLRDELLVEFNDNGAKMGFARPARVRSLLTRTERLTLYGDESWGELYDRAANPDETRNLWDDPEACGLKADLTVRLAHQLTALMDESPRGQRLA